MYTVEIDIAEDVFNAVSSQVSRSGDLMEKAYRREVTKVRQRITRRLKPPSKLPVLPFIWSRTASKDARARRWYFANKVRGRGGGRYQRTGKIAAGWKLKTDLKRAGGVITLSNSVPGVEYVMGNRQVPSHKRTGWVNVQDASTEFSQILTDNASEIWFTIADPFGGIRQP